MAYCVPWFEVIRELHIIFVVSIMEVLNDLPILLGFFTIVCLAWTSEGFGWTDSSKKGF